MQEDEAHKTEFQDLVSRLATSVVTAHTDRVGEDVYRTLRRINPDLKVLLTTTTSPIPSSAWLAKGCRDLCPSPSTWTC